MANIGCFLGLNLSPSGIGCHIKTATNRAEAQLDKLDRFRELPAQIKLRLYKSIVRPLLDYPAVPMHALSPSALSPLQVVQNKATRFVLGVRWWEFRSSEDLHGELELEPVNQRLYHMADKIWSRI